MVGDTPISEIRTDFIEHITKNWNPVVVSEQIKSYDKNVLVYLNEYLFCKEKDLPFDLADNTHVEHIMPASGKNISVIRKDAGIDNLEEFNSCVNKLGNKILLEAAINQAISNDWFKTKKRTTIDDRTGYRDSKFHLAKSLANYPNDLWSRSDIVHATERVSTRIISFIFQN